MIAADVAQASGGKLHIVTAYDPKSVDTRTAPARRPLLRRPPRRGAAAPPLGPRREHGLEPVVHAAEGDPADAIVRVAEEVRPT